MAETKLGFWGAIVAPGENYKVTTPEGRVLRISSAALDSNNTEKRSSLVIYDPTSSSEHVICTLIPNVTPHCHLDLFFVGNRDITFKVHGNGNIHLTGYTTFLESGIGGPPFDYFQEEADESDEDFATLSQAMTRAQSGEEESDEDDFISSPTGKSPQISLLSDQDTTPQGKPTATPDKKSAKRKDAPQQKSDQKQKKKQPKNRSTISS